MLKFLICFLHVTQIIHARNIYCLIFVFHIQSKVFKINNELNIYEKYRFTLGTKCMLLYTIVEESTRTSKRCAMFVFASLSAHCNSYETFKKLSFLLHFTDRVTGTSVQEYIL